MDYLPPGQKGRPDKKGIETSLFIKPPPTGKLGQKGRPDKKGIETVYCH